MFTLPYNSAIKEGVHMSISRMLGKVLYEYKNENKLTQTAMSEICGVSTRHYIDLEVGRVDPLLSTVVKIAAATGIDLNSIVREYAASEEILKR